MDSHHCSRHGDSAVIPAPTHRKVLLEMQAQGSLVTVRSDELTVPKGWHTLQKLIPGQRCHAVTHMLIENHSRNIGHGQQRFRGAVREVVAEAAENAVMVGEYHTLLGPVLPEEGTAADTCRLGKLIN